MAQLDRFLTPADPEDASESSEYPFVLKAVLKDGLTCAVCPWWKLCTGCTIECDDEPFDDLTAYLAIEWDVTAQHLRYQPGQERLVTDDKSVEQCNQSQTNPIDLMECLTAFTKEEELGEEELWYCGKCKQHQMAAKKLDIWRLPPLLIVHLKRFQFVNGQWVKSMKKVKYPLTQFNLNDMVVQPASKSKESEEKAGDDELTTKDVAEVMNGEGENGVSCDSDVTNQDEKSGDQSCEPLPNGDVSPDESKVPNGQQAHDSDDAFSSDETGVKKSPSSPRLRQQSVREPADCDPLTSALVLEAVRQADIKDGILPEDEEQPSRSAASSPQPGVIHTMAERLGTAGHPEGASTYNLYAMTIHSGLMGGGHYVSFACNPDGNWYLYNDSSCKKIDAEVLKDESPYLLFYERSDINYQTFLPEKRSRSRNDVGDDDDLESEFKRCKIM